MRYGVRWGRHRQPDFDWLELYEVHFTRKSTPTKTADQNTSHDQTSSTSATNGQGVTSSAEEIPDGPPFDLQINPVKEGGRNIIDTPAFEGRYGSRREGEPQANAVMRLGTRPDNRFATIHDDAVPMTHVVGVEVWWDSDIEESLFKLRETESWFVNGMSIGDWENGTLFEQKDEIDNLWDKLELDDMFVSTETFEELTRAVHAFVSLGYEEIPLATYLRLQEDYPDYDKINLAVAPPLIPDTTQAAYPGAENPDPDNEPIHTVIRFRNVLADEDITLEVKLQATITDCDDKAAEMRKYIYEGGSCLNTRAAKYKGLKTRMTSATQSWGYYCLSKSTFCHRHQTRVP